MKKTGIKLMLVIISIACANFVQAQKNINKTFTVKEKLKISTVSGNCTIKKSEANQIDVQLIYTYSDDCFKYEFEEGSDNLTITEKIRGNRCSGKSEWSISVPDNTKIWFNTASGDFWISNMKNGLSADAASGNMKLKNISGEITMNTASGDVSLQKINGELKITTASGNIKIESLDAKTSISVASGDINIIENMQDVKISTASGNVNIEGNKGNLKANIASGDVQITKSTGACNINTASGDINASEIELTDESSFSTASGDIEVVLNKSSEKDLSLSTASGNITLDYNGNEVSGFFEFTAREDKGKIISPYKFDIEEVFEKDGKKYDKKSFTKGSDSPKVVLKTSSGNVELKK